MIDIAYAMGQTGAAGGQGAGGGFQAFIPLILMGVIFYFLLIRPQQKKNKQHKEMLELLKKGDRVITSGGIHGRITTVNDNSLSVEIAEKIRVKIGRQSIATLIKPSSQPSQEKKKSNQEKKKIESEKSK